ncbi:MAG: S41 family peptidase [Acidobacteria bacterium]|nr:S41 family peptidase [Acidobacteriota bacterium]
MTRPWRNLSALLFTLALLAASLFGSRLQALDDQTRESMQLYTELLTKAHEAYGGDVSYRDLVYASIGGLSRTLDPHTNFLPPQAYDGMRERQRSSFYGLGILIGLRNNRVTVITPIEGGPASRLGIRAGDIIDTIDGESTESLSLDDAVSKLKGPKGTPVTITILRSGLDEPLEMTVERAEIPLTTVRHAYMMTPEVGYLRLTDFNRATGKEVADAIEHLRAEGMKKLLLDLRNNGGGLLDQAIEVGDQFLPAGAKIVETRGRTRNSQQTFFAEERYGDLGVPVVVLVNSGTASAAEILSGAIQDHDVGLIVGTPTWGKGLVQTVYSLSYGAGLALTTARYYTPSGRLIQRDYSSPYDYYAYNPLSATDAEGNPAPAPHTADEQSFLTDLGRTVYGGGGITPDVLVELDEVSPFLQLLHTRSAFFDFAVEYSADHPVDSESWRPGPGVLDRFRGWLLEHDLGTAEKVDEQLADQETRDYIARQLRAEIFNATFGQDAWHRALAEGDRQIQKGLQLFGRAGDLLASRRNLQEEIDRRAALERP